MGWVKTEKTNKLSKLGDIDFTTTAPVDGNALVYDETNDVWIPGAGGGSSGVELTQAEYDQLTQEEKNNGTIYKITDKAKIYCLDEEYHAVKEITSADYALLTSDEKNNGTLYVITDKETTAADIPYSAGVSVADKLDEIKVDKLTFNTTINTTMGAFYRSAFITVDISSYGFTNPPKIFIQPLSENAYPIGVLVLAQSITATSFQFAFVSGQSSMAEDVETFIFMHGN